MPTPSAEDQRPSARLTSLFPSGMSDGKAERGSRKRDGEKEETGEEKETVRNRAEGFAASLCRASRKSSHTTVDFRSWLSRSLSLNRTADFLPRREISTLLPPVVAGS